MRQSIPTPTFAVPPQPPPTVPAPAHWNTRKDITFALKPPPGPSVETAIPPPQPHTSDARGDHHRDSRGRRGSTNNDHHDAPRGTRARSPPHTTRRGQEDSRSRHQGRFDATTWLDDSDSPERADRRHRRSSLSPEQETSTSPERHQRRGRRDDKGNKGDNGDKDLRMTRGNNRERDAERVDSEF
jgi:hypothetical protein